MDSYLDSVKDVYSNSDIYHKENEFFISYYAQRICELSSGGGCLDLGLGHGITIKLFEKRFNRYVVVEGSGKLIKDYYNTNPDTNVEICQSFFESYETNEKFDVIIMGFVLEHVDDPLLILKKFKAFLKPEGIMYAAVPNCETLNRRIAMEAGMISRMDFFTERCLASGHKQLFTMNSFKDVILAAGLSVEMMEGFYLKPITTPQMLALNWNDDILWALMSLGKNYPELSFGLLAVVKHK